MSNSQKAKETAWIGLDVDSKFVVAALDLPAASGTNRVHPRDLPTQTFERSRGGLEKMLAWADNLAKGPVAFRVVMESTGCYSEEVQAWLYEIAPQTDPAVMNPKIMKDFLSSLDPRTKCDRVDSQGIARFGTERTPAPSPMLSPARRAVRDLMRTRELLVGQRDAARNRRSTIKDKECVAILDSAVKQLQKQIDRALKQALKIVREGERTARDLARMTEVFGVGEITALTMLAELGDLRRFQNAAQLSSYCGVTPKIEESGGKCKQPRMSKFGNPNVRRALYMPAVVNVRYEKTDISMWYRHAVGRGMPPRKAIVQVMRKILERLYLMVTTTKTYERFPCKSGAARQEVCG